MKSTVTALGIAILFVIVACVAPGEAIRPQQTDFAFLDIGLSG
ncbi:MAG: hypothetical protein O6952_07435 [Planctomycetota bacterium]|nr:hypothetical protein [Planctomycetota bacterium]